MVDDWSLKDKEYNLVLYRTSDIDVLRRKLIEDFEKWFNETLEGSEKWEDIEDIVNKRFGVD